MPTLTKDEKQTALEKHKVILSATLDYLMNHFTGTIVCDDFDPMKDYYEQQKIQVDKYFKQRRLDRLEQQFRRLIEHFKHSLYLEFEHYIRETTGHEINIFAKERTIVAEVLAKQRIDNEEESRVVNLMLTTNQFASRNEEKVLKFFLVDFFTRKNQFGELSAKKKNVSSEVVKIVEKDGIITETVQISVGPKPVHFNQREVLSPDGKRRFNITEWGDGKHPSTFVTVCFDKASGPVYGANGLYPDLNAFWRDNNTIVIQIKKNYVSGLKHRKVQSFDDIIFVEYMESEEQ
jgi:hypothetical protein